MSLVNGVTLIKWSEMPFVGNLAAGDQIVGLRNGLNKRFSFSGAGSQTNFETSINQVAHGFSVGQVLTLSGTIYILAKADSATTSDAIGMVQSVTDADDFVLVYGGLISGLSGLTAGTTYFLSPSVAGAYTATAPTTPGECRVVLFKANTTTSCYWLNNCSQQL